MHDTPLLMNDLLKINLCNTYHFYVAVTLGGLDLCVTHVNYLMDVVSSHGGCLAIYYTSTSVANQNEFPFDPILHKDASLSLMSAHLHLMVVINNW